MRVGMIKLWIRFLYMGGKNMGRVKLQIRFLYVGGKMWVG
jgi:hypothetical protein